MKSTCRIYYFASKLAHQWFRPLYVFSPIPNPWTCWCCEGVRARGHRVARRGCSIPWSYSEGCRLHVYCGLHWHGGCRCASSATNRCAFAAGAMTWRTPPRLPEIAGPARIRLALFVEADSILFLWQHGSTCWNQANIQSCNCDLSKLLRTALVCANLSPWCLSSCWTHPSYLWKNNTLK